MRAGLAGIRDANVTRRVRTRLRHTAISLGVAVGVTVAPNAFGAGPVVASATDPRPNVVVIMTDDQTVESMRVMDNAARRIAAKGVTFTNSYASYPLCCPSRATYLTGQYSHNNGVRDNRPPEGGYEVFRAGAEATALPVAMQAAGYRTTHVGKYLNGYGRADPLAVPPGWTKWFGVTGRAYGYFGFTLNKNGRLKEYGTADTDYQSDVVRRLAARRIRTDAPRDEPFFLSITPVAPHNGDSDRKPGVRKPWPAPRHAGRFGDEPLPRPPSFNEADVADKPELIRLQEQLPKEKVKRIERHYRRRLETLLAVDGLVRKVVRELRRVDELADTVIVYTSDNGFMQGEHRLERGKRVHYEEASRVPLVVRGPGLAEGVTADALVSNADLAPTILDLADTAPLRVPDGRSLLPLLAEPGSNAWADADVLIESGYRPGPGGLSTSPAKTAFYYGIRSGQYKYVEWENGDRELYDLLADPYELTNRAGDPALAAVEADLAARLAAIGSCAGANCHPA